MSLALDMQRSEYRREAIRNAERAVEEVRRLSGVRYENFARDQQRLEYLREAEAEAAKLPDLLKGFHQNPSRFFSARR